QQPRHPPDDAHPDEGGEHEDEEQAPEVGIGGGVAGGRRGGGLREEGEQAHAPALASASRVRAWRTSPAWVMTAPCWMSSLKSSTKAFSLVNACPKAARVREQSRLAWCGMLAGTLSGARIVTPPSTTVSPGRDSSQLPPPSAPRSTMTAPGFMERTVAASSSRGAKTPPMSAVVITTSDWAHCS